MYDGYSKRKGLVVQLVRMPPCHGGGRGFESRPDRKAVPLRGTAFVFYALSANSEAREKGF